MGTMLNAHAVGELIGAVVFIPAFKKQFGGING